MNAPDRRAMLRAVGLGGLGLASGGSGALLAGCQSGSGSTPATPADWDGLARRLTGPLLRPADPDYDSARLLFDPAFDPIRPQAVARVASAADVAACVDFARAAGVPIAARAGGHSYAGYSTTTGLVVDLTSLATVQPAAGGTARIGAGALLIDVYSELAKGGLALPAGSCPTVGIAGLALGGGIGVVGRHYGLTCDRMLSAEVVLASGEIVHADSDTEPDLFWALRGAGGGNFGVVTSFTFATHQAAPLVLFTYRWPWSAAADVLRSWQAWIADAGGAPESLWSTCVVASNPTSGVGGTPTLRISGVLAGPTGDPEITQLRARLADLVTTVGTNPTSTFIGRRGHLETMLIEGGCSGKSIEACHLRGRTPGGTLSRVPQLAASAFLDQPMPAGGIEVLLAAIEQRQRTAGAGSGGVILDSWGGAINRVAPDETAFVHRTSIASAQYVAGYAGALTPSTQEDNRRWLRSTVRSTAPYVSRSAYQNYIDPDLTTWADAYYGANLPRLRRVKHSYDPDDLFSFPQGIANT